MPLVGHNTPAERLRAIQARIEVRARLFGNHNPVKSELSLEEFLESGAAVLDRTNPISENQKILFAQMWTETATHFYDKCTGSTILPESKSTKESRARCMDIELPKLYVERFERATRGFDYGYIQRNAYTNLLKDMVYMDKYVAKLEEPLIEKKKELVQLKKIAKRETAAMAELFQAVAKRGAVESIMYELGNPGVPGSPLSLRRGRQITPNEREVFVNSFGKALGTRAGKPLNASDSSKKRLAKAIFITKFNQWNGEVHSVIDCTNSDKVDLVFIALEYEKEEYIKAALHNLMSYGYEFKLGEEIWGMGFNTRGQKGHSVVDGTIPASVRAAWSKDWVATEKPLPPTPPEYA
ncbi:hypothetical protein BJ508DRAFT_336162 [Ascobolus immersus RN42]|uniref:Uncharacterized protein n=1 Tax=Ascobolus immersus RN42 TaxID=1160509 RepID=A0A3N4H9F8_ASCIM|nr:hypothetical protein BJ508DRAFT_336162 [Ascobolus immersus RN42]